MNACPAERVRPLQFRVQQGFVCEGQRHGVDVIQPPGMRHRLFGV